jgi:ribosome-associated protein
MKQIVKINSPMIQLNQLLKWIGILETGGQISFLMEEATIFINGIVVHEKRKKIYPGDIVTIAGENYIIVYDDEVNDEC